MENYNLHKEMKNLVENITEKIYGMAIDFKTRKVSYLGENKDFSPLRPATDSSNLDFGGWSDWDFLKENRPAMCSMDGEIDYYLNENDYTKKEDGSTSDISNIDYSGNAMAVVPKIYSLSYEISQKRYVYFCKEKISEAFAPVGFDVKGTVRDYMLIPMFYGSVDSQGRMRSIANQWSAGTVSGTSLQNQYGKNMDVDEQMKAALKTSPSGLLFGGAIVNILCDIATMLTKSLPENMPFGSGVANGCTTDDDIKGHHGSKINTVTSCAFSGDNSGNSFSTMFHSVVPGSSMIWQRDPYTALKYGKLLVSKDYSYDAGAEGYTDTGLCITESSYYDKTIFIDGFGAFPDPDSAGTDTGCFAYASDKVFSFASRFGCMRNGDKRSLFMFSINHSAFNETGKNRDGMDVATSKKIDETFSWWWNFGASLMLPCPVLDK